MTDAVIVAALRTPVGRAQEGALRNFRPDELAAPVIRALLEKFPDVARDEIDDVILGCAMPECAKDLNIARAAAMRAGLPDSVPGVTVNRLCASGLEAIAIAAERIRTGSAQIIIAGGAESMSHASHWSDAWRQMGLAAEHLARRYGISREEQDEFALRSHQRALAAQEEGRLSDEIVPVVVEETLVENGKPQTYRYWFSRDEGPRANVSMESLSKLRAAFQHGGAATSGNSSRTGDGAAAVVIMSSRKARRLRLPLMARFASYATAGVPPDIMGIGAAVAIPKALALASARLSDIETIELNEDFASQSIAVMREADLDESIMNVNGGAIALGNPLGCTGAKLTVAILHQLQRSHARAGMVAMSVGGGQGAAGVFERA